MISLLIKVGCCLKKIMVESLLFIGAGAGAGQKRTGSATLTVMFQILVW